jgi:predicted enzyme related to lactoylglutathione lyase
VELEVIGMGDIVYFELPADDPARAKKFYKKLFDWKFDKMPKWDYWMITTGGKDALYGGLTKREKTRPAVVNYIDVESVEECGVKIEKAGGKILVPKTPVKGWGYYAIFKDTENNVLGIWEDDESAR